MAPRRTRASWRTSALDVTIFGSGSESPSARTSCISLTRLQLVDAAYVMPSLQLVPPDELHGEARPARSRGRRSWSMGSVLVLHGWLHEGPACWVS